MREPKYLYRPRDRHSSWRVPEQYLNPAWREPEPSFWQLFKEELPRATRCVAMSAIILLIVTALAGCENGYSQRQNADRIEKQIERDRGR